VFRRASVSLRWLAALLIALGLLTSVGVAAPAIPQNGSVIIPPGSPIQIAVATCNTFTTFQDHLDAVQMAMDDYGLIKGFSLQRNDDATLCDTPTGASAAGAIVANAQNVGVIGPLLSPSTIGAAPVFETAGVVMISHGNTQADLPTFAPNVFNRTTVPNPEGDAWVLTVNGLPSAVAWRADFESTYGRSPDPLAVLAHDAATLLLTRIDQVSTVDGSGNLVIDRAALAAAVRNTANMPGASGPISLEVNGDRVNNYTTIVWTDQFAGPSPDPLWTWVDEDATHWSLTDLPGFLRVITQQENRNRLVRNAPMRDFEIRTRELFTPTQNFQVAGLYIYGDDSNFLVLGRAYCNAAPPTCVGNGIYFDRIEGGSPIGSNYAMTTTVQNEAYLRIVSDGSDLTGYVSENGTAWTQVGTHTIGFVPTQVGLIAGNNFQVAGEIPANFDFFVLEYAAYRVYLPVITRAYGP
jgi:Beta xylosidase C-terminal Concanavalin A-like domain